MHVLPEFWRGDHVVWIFVVKTCVNRSGRFIVLYGLLFAAPTCVWEGQRIGAWDNWELLCSWVVANLLH